MLGVPSERWTSEFDAAPLEESELAAGVDDSGRGWYEAAEGSAQVVRTAEDATVCCRLLKGRVQGRCAEYSHRRSRARQRPQGFLPLHCNGNRYGEGLN